MIEHQNIFAVPTAQAVLFTLACSGLPHGNHIPTPG